MEVSSSGTRGIELYFDLYYSRIRTKKVNTLKDYTADECLI